MPFTFSFQNSLILRLPIYTRFNFYYYETEAIDSQGIVKYL